MIDLAVVGKKVLLVMFLFLLISLAPPGLSVASAQDSQLIDAKIQEAKNGDVSSLNWLVTAAKALVVEQAKRNTADEYWYFGKQYEIGIQNRKLSDRSQSIFRAVGHISNEAALDVASYCLDNYKNDVPNRNRFISCVSTISSYAGFSRENDEGPSSEKIDQFGELVYAKALLILSHDTRGISKVVRFIDPLTKSVHEEVKTAAIMLMREAKAKQRGAPPPNDDLAFALGQALVKSWFTPLKPDQKNLADTLADDLTIDLLLQ